MPRVTVTLQSKGQELNEWLGEIESVALPEFRGKAYDLMNEIHEFMRSQIRNNIKRLGNTGNLEKNITCGFEEMGGKFEWCFWIGDINLLNENAKYWYWQNYGVAQTGRSIPPINRGFFAGGLGLTGQGTPPRAGMEGEQWIHTGQGYLMIPKKTIPAMNYIENSIHELESKIPGLLEGLEKVGGTGGGVMGKKTYVGAWGKAVRFGQGR